MSVSIDKFWQLVASSRLLPRERCNILSGRWSGIKGAATSDSALALSEWLVAERQLTRYQASVLLSAKPGPFVFDEYRVTDLISQGRFKGLFRAVHAPTGHPVLLQFFSGPVAEDVALWSKVHRELLGVASNRHAHLYQLYEAVIYESYCFAVAEFVEGESLESILHDGRVLSVNKACHLAMQVAVGVAHLHHRGKVHGEIRPENIWIDQHGFVKVLTGSLARDMERPAGYFDLAHANHDSRMKVAANYLAPELAERTAEPTHGSDLYAIGCVLYEMLAGRPPFTADVAAEVVHQHAVDNLPRITAQKVPTKLLRALSTMMAKEPGLRFSSPDVAAVALKMLTSQEPAVQTASPPSTLPAFLKERSARLEQAKKSKKDREDVIHPAASAALVSEKTAADDLAEDDGNQATPDRPNRPTHRSKRQPDPPTTGSESQRSETDPLQTRLKAGRRRSVAAAILFVAIAAALVTPFFLRFDQSTPGGTGAPGPTSADGTEPNDTGASERQTKPPNNDSAVGLGDDRHSRETVTKDDGRLLWASPTSGRPIDLTYSPPGCQLFFVLRPALLLEHTEGEKVLAAMGPWGITVADNLRQRVGVPIEQIDRLAVGIANVGTTQDLAVSYVVNLAEGVSAKSLAAGQGRAKMERAGAEYFTDDDAAFFCPNTEDDCLLITAPVETMEQIIDQGPSVPPMRREFERLLETTDADRHATLLIAPHFLFADGQTVLAGNAKRLREPLLQFFGEGLVAAALSLHWGEDFFAELRLAGTLDEPPKKLARSFKRQIPAASEKIEEYVLSFQREPYGRRLLARLPEMLRRLSNYTRSGVEKDHAILRAYLPRTAGHNLLMATELLIAETPRAQSGPTVTAQADDAPIPVRDRLKKVTSVSFPRDTLEIAVKMLAEDIGVEIVILGGDLQLDGITKNQSFGLDERDKTASQILLSILRLANPDKTATGPADPKQKLIYVIKPRSPGNEEIVFVTTRVQAEKRGDTIPEVFRVKE